MFGSGIPVQSQVSWRVQIFVSSESTSATNPKNNTRVDVLLLGTLGTVILGQNEKRKIDKMTDRLREREGGERNENKIS